MIFRTTVFGLGWRVVLRSWGGSGSRQLLEREASGSNLDSLSVLEYMRASWAEQLCSRSRGMNSGADPETHRADALLTELKASWEDRGSLPTCRLVDAANPY